MLGHMVYFTLKDRSPAAIDKLLGDCRKYLTDHPGTVFFAAGKLVPDLTRPVNQTDFDVALQVVFESRARSRRLSGCSAARAVHRREQAELGARARVRRLR